MDLKTDYKNNITPLLATLITAIALLLSFWLYICNNLHCNINWHFLPSKMFGPPQYLADQGFDAFYNKENCGWDGQFYFWIANDPLDLRETKQNIDNPPYRYQRIGLPLTANLLSKIFLQKNVTPTIYFLANFSAIILGCFFLAKFLNQHGASPYLAMIWGFSVGNILSINNGMPDGFSEAFFLMALIAFFTKNTFFYAISASLSCLAREQMILPYLVIFLLMVLGFLLDRKKEKIKFLEIFNQLRNQYGRGWMVASLIPILIFLTWQTYIAIHFGRTSFSDSGSVISWVPLVSFIKNLYPSISQLNLITGLVLLIMALPTLFVFYALITLFLSYYSFLKIKTEPLNLAFCTLLFLIIFKDYYSTLCLLTFVIMLFLSFSLLIKIISSPIKNFRIDDRNLILSFKIMSLALLPLITLYMFLGNTVLMHYTGYLKIFGLFIITILSFALHQKSQFLLRVLLICCAINLTMLFSDRISSNVNTGAEWHEINHK